MKRNEEAIGFVIFRLTFRLFLWLGTIAFMVKVLINQRELITVNKEIREIIKNDFEEELFDKSQDVVLTCLLNEKDKLDLKKTYSFKV